MVASWQGFDNFIAKFPDDKLTVVVSTNLNHSKPGLIGRNVAAFYITELSRSAVTVIKDNSAALINPITELYKNPLKADLNSSFFAKEAMPAIKLLTIIYVKHLDRFNLYYLLNSLEIHTKFF